MPEYLSPGVYVEEVDTGNKPIEGVATSTVGFLGITERGPVTPTLVTSFSEFTRLYGRYVANGFLPYGAEGFFQNGGKRCFVARVASSTAAAGSVASGTFTVSAIGPGTWANGRLAIKVSNAGLHDPANAPTQSLFKLTLIYWDPSVGTLPTPLVDPTDPANLLNANRREPTIVEQFDNVSPDSLSSSFVEKMVNGSSMLVTATLTGGTRPGNTAALLTPANGGNGGALVINDFAGDPAALPGNRRGLAALEEIDEIAILSCPDEHALPNVQIGGRLVEQCERLKDRFVILQCLPQAGSINNLRPYLVSKYAAFYYPWITINDPLTDQPRDIPPSGHIAGIYARSDIERGVHKAPANEVIRGLYIDPVDPTAGLQFNIVKGQQDILNPRGVNVLRYFPGRGNLVWGARTSTLDPDWRYINVRRLFIYVEESIEEATQWVVFEPNDEPTWVRVRRAVSAFLTGLWRDGMLQGRTAEEAYFVRCDRTTMTQADIDNGKLIVLIGIAPVKPAEFVIFRIGQWTGGSEVTEG
jgi:phage tail sheath protein FI